MRKLDQIIALYAVELYARVNILDTTGSLRFGEFLWNTTYVTPPAYRGFAQGWFPKGWFWQMFPCTEISSTKSFPAVLPWQEKAMFDVPGPQQPKRGT